MTEQPHRDSPVRTIDADIDSAEALAERFPDFDAVDAAFTFERDEHGCLRHFDDYACGGTSAAICDLAEQRRLWTMVDGQGGRVWICAGFAFVNRLTYLATVKPVPHALFDLGLTVEG